ncbi:uncharacterized protein EV420DRAFT_751927 [Desarmillaria tabescens]|uniref:F-box domain-containing protein n=1 Tax=Armillaria tabescens TaxID=1929756 RepID=A0AA39JX46_ARMTA|nr:uncharacterized protein EV420DRAFT_751927 [Desarmillaria tabescens]KAK0450383.1 hypothetical protein EV420DRAFT_751927 [Desarmillaria tabescens]
MNIDPNSALSRVPPEIFSEIFSLASDGQSLRYNQGLWSIGRVCGRWRSIVLSDPTLWAHLRISLKWAVDEEPIPYNVLPYDGGFPWNASVFPSSMGEAPEHHTQEIVALADEALASLPVIRDYTCITPRTVALLLKHLSRSQAAPLTIDLTAPSNRMLSTDVYLMRFFQLIFSQSRRFKDSAPLSI